MHGYSNTEQLTGGQTQHHGMYFIHNIHAHNTKRFNRINLLGSSYKILHCPQHWKNPIHPNPVVWLFPFLHPLNIEES